MEDRFTSPTKLILSVRDKQTGEIQWQDVQALARLYVNYFPPTNLMLTLVPTWPITSLFAGYHGLRQYFDMYVGKLKHFSECKDDVRAITELLRLYAAQNDWHEGYYDGVVGGVCFSDPVDRTKEMSDLFQLLEDLIRMGRCEEEVKDKSLKWQRALSSTEDKGFGDAPFYEFAPSDGDLEDRDRFTCRQSYGHEFFSCGDNDPMVSDMPYDKRLERYFELRPDLALRILRTNGDGSAWVGNAHAIALIVERFGKQYAAAVDLQVYDDLYEKAKALVRCIEKEDQLAYADREFDLVRHAFDFKYLSDRIGIIEDKALVGSAQACLCLHDYCLRQDTDIHCMANFWWALRDKFLKDFAWQQKLNSMATKV